MKIDFCAYLMRVVVKNTQQALAGDCEIEDGTRRGKLVCVVSFFSFFVLDSFSIPWTGHFFDKCLTNYLLILVRFRYEVIST